jgi:hypothetical protein
MKIGEVFFRGDAVRLGNERLAYLDAEEIPPGLGHRHTQDESPAGAADVEVKRLRRIRKYLRDIDRLGRLSVIRG